MRLIWADGNLAAADSIAAVTVNHFTFMFDETCDPLVVCAEDCAMDIPVPSIETIKLAWNWSLEQLQLWFDVLRNPSEVLKTIDLDSTDSLIVALKFAIFPIWLTCLVTLPPYLLQKDASLGLIGYFVVSTVAQAVLILVTP